MPHLRLNEKEARPNPNINWITALPASGSRRKGTETEAHKLLECLAAQVKPTMKAHGFNVNSLEEYEHNRVFLGRNWNAGETVELVLRQANGSFWSPAHLLNVFCHELAHIKHMHHGPEFHKLWAQLRNEVYELQAKGYFGDGYWGAGARLVDSSIINPPLLTSETALPQYLCGGAQNRSSSHGKSLKRRRGVRQEGQPSLHTGAQTVKKRKPGARVTRIDAFGPEGTAGRALNEDAKTEGEKSKGTGFRKQAGSNRAREERALAAERRLAALAAQTKGKDKEFPEPRDEESDTASESDEDEEQIPETDADRLRALHETTHPDDLKSPSTLKQPGIKDFFEPIGQVGPSAAKDDSSSAELSSLPAKSLFKKSNLVQAEVTSRKLEAVGLNQVRRVKPVSASSKQGQSKLLSDREISMRQSTPPLNEIDPWVCGVCTLENHPDYGLCNVCGVRRGGTSPSDEGIP